MMTGMAASCSKVEVDLMVSVENRLVMMVLVTGQGLNVVLPLLRLIPGTRHRGLLILHSLLIRKPHSISRSRPILK